MVDVPLGKHILMSLYNKLLNDAQEDGPAILSQR